MLKVEVKKGNISGALKILKKKFREFYGSNMDNISRFRDY